jgi:hypothetical protein
VPEPVVFARLVENELSSELEVPSKGCARDCWEPVGAFTFAAGAAMSSLP